MRAQFQPSRHMVKRLAMALSIAGSAGCVFAGNPELVEVGSIPTRCPVTLEASSVFRLPDGWKVTPEQAVSLAASVGHAKCNSIFLQVLYADANNYYLVKPVFGPVSRSAGAVVINPISGKVSVQGEAGT
ncbi:hypothetical protein AACH06_28930 [Ideonella sp. DXS29W]|uniref:Uncharacterized protein n=1 Tax=Ideonella lacteola TaxID=2984193 RepID=A0ABU9C1C7_9BURK